MRQRRTKRRKRSALADPLAAIKAGSRAIRAGGQALFGGSYAPPGSAPGTLRPVAEAPSQPVKISVIRYDEGGPEEIPEATLDEVPAAGAEGGVVWIDVVGLHDLQTLSALGERFGLHALSLEDVLNLGHRPKLEEHDDHLFAVSRLFRLGAGLESEQISIFLGESWVLTFQEKPGDVFEPVRERIRHGKGRIRRCGADYLAYALLDAMVDHFFPILEAYGERLETLEEKLIENPRREDLETLYRIKKDLLALRRTAWPQREIVQSFERQESALVRKETRVFLRDLYDHAVQILDMVETFRDLGNGLMDLYLSSVSNRMNEVMKVLTVMASIFIPLTFLAGIYGMNFDPDSSPLNMPELSWYWGYPAFWLVIVVLGAGMVYLFRRRGWF